MAAGAAVRAPDFWQQDGLWPRLLAPLGALYRTWTQLRRLTVRPAVADAPVVCIGNLTVGGAGKTPTALAVAIALQGQGIAVHFLSRGYGGRLHGPRRVDPAHHTAADVGDEPLLLARTAPTWIGADRAQSAAAAVAAGAGVLVMDDGFQNPGLAKDLSLVVIDGDGGFGNGRVLPAGPLREPIAEGLARADAIVQVGDGDLPEAAAGLPVLAARFVPSPATLDLKGCAVLAFAGIARPAKFVATLEEIGARVVAARPFPDHHPYRPEDIMRVCEEAAALGATPVTTEKDMVRLAPEARHMVRAVPVTLAFADAGALERVLRPVLERAGR